MISDFRIYKLDNNKIDNGWTENTILSMIQAGLGNEFVKKSIPSLNFKQLSSDIKYYSFNGIDVDEDHDGPIWYEFLKLLGENDEYQEMVDKYTHVRTSILTVFKLSGNYYLIAFGNAFHSLPKSLIDEVFGIEIGKKLITQTGKLKSLSQSVITGDLENTYKSLKNNSAYNPMTDMTNLGKLTKGLNGAINTNEIFHDIEELKNLHMGLDGNKGLKIKTQSIDKHLFSKLLVRINEIYNTSQPNALKIPDLKKILPNSELYLKLIELITDSINNGEKTVYFSPDRFKEYISFFDGGGQKIKEFKIHENGNAIMYTYDRQGMLEYLDLLKYLQESSFNISDVSQVTISSIKSVDSHGEANPIGKMPKLLHCLTGELEYDGELYLFDGGKFYQPNQDFQNIVISDFEDKLENLKITETDFMHDWNISDQVPGTKHAEAKFNGAHDKGINSSLGKADFYCFDKGVSGKYGMNGIEICDLIKHDDTLYFIHVKKNHGADLRVLFSQGRVGTQKILENLEDTNNHIITKSSLRNIKNKIRTKNFTIVYAIKNPNPTSVFTLYAKYDFINTIEHFHNKGINNVKIYMIN